MGEGKRFAVIRDPDSPKDGWWFDIGELSGNVFASIDPRAHSATYGWNGQYERREDGMSGRVYVPIANDAKGDVLD